MAGFNECTRVQVPAALHLCRLGYTYFAETEACKTTMGHITTDHLNQSRIAIPDKETMKRFSSQVTPLFKKQLVNSQQIETLTTQRNTLLPLLMTGQVEVV